MYNLHLAVVLGTISGKYINIIKQVYVRKL